MTEATTRAWTPLAMSIWLSAEDACAQYPFASDGDQAAAAVIATALADMQRGLAAWVFPRSKADMPKKPGKAQYEYVECLVLLPKGELLTRPWNCQHEVFDDEDQDDHFCEWSEVTAYMDLTAIREAARQALSDKTQEKNDG